jgi:hypothetical protein
MVLMRTILLHKVGGLLEQILQTQQRTYAFVERIFVSDHAAAESKVWKFFLF